MMAGGSEVCGSLSAECEGDWRFSLERSAPITPATITPAAGQEPHAPGWERRAWLSAVGKRGMERRSGIGRDVVDGARAERAVDVAADQQTDIDVGRHGMVTEPTEVQVHAIGGNGRR